MGQGPPVKGIHMKNKAKIVIAAGAVLASTLAVAPVQAHAATRTLTGSCSKGFACAWDTNNVLFWEANGPANIHFAINENVTYVENRTDYDMFIYCPWGSVELGPGAGPYDLVSDVEYIELET
jgi:hypothetical protein